MKPDEVKLGAVLVMNGHAEDVGSTPGLGGFMLQNPRETIVPERSGRVRFSHRNPPRTSYGTEVLQQQLYEANKWMHLVAVKNESQLKLYVNGRLAGAVDDATTWAQDEFVTLIGVNLPSPIAERRRSFFGLIDEVAIYDRALSDDQVREHFERLIVLLED